MRVSVAALIALPLLLAAFAGRMNIDVDRPTQDFQGMRLHGDGTGLLEEYSNVSDASADVAKAMAQAAKAAAHAQKLEQRLAAVEKRLADMEKVSEQQSITARLEASIEDSAHDVEQTEKTHQIEQHHNATGKTGQVCARCMKVVNDEGKKTFQCVPMYKKNKNEFVMWVNDMCFGGAADDAYPECEGNYGVRGFPDSGDEEYSQIYCNRLARQPGLSGDMDSCKGCCINNLGKPAGGSSAKAWAAQCKNKKVSETENLRSVVQLDAGGGDTDE